MGGGSPVSVTTVSFARAPRTRSDKTAKCKFSWLLHSKLLWPGYLISLHSDCRRNALSEAGHHSAGFPSHILFACSPNKDFLDATHLSWALLLSRWVSFGSLATCLDPILWKCPKSKNILCWCNLPYELTDSVVVVVVVVIVIYLLSTSLTDVDFCLLWCIMWLLWICLYTLRQLLLLWIS